MEQQEPTANEEDVTTVSVAYKKTAWTADITGPGEGPGDAHGATLPHCICPIRVSFHVCTSLYKSGLWRRQNCRLG